MLLPAGPAPPMVDTAPAVATFTVDMEHAEPIVEYVAPLVDELPQLQTVDRIVGFPEALLGSGSSGWSASSSGIHTTQGRHDTRFGRPFGCCGVLPTRSRHGMRGSSRGEDGCDPTVEEHRRVS